MKMYHSNEYLLAKIGVDTIENEPLKNSDNMYANLHAWHVRKFGLHARHATFGKIMKISMASRVYLLCIFFLEVSTIFLFNYEKVIEKDEDENVNQYFISKQSTISKEGSRPSI